MGYPYAGPSYAELAVTREGNLVRSLQRCDIAGGFARDFVVVAVRMAKHAHNLWIIKNKNLRYFLASRAAQHL
eukprot:scaffold300542_cov35-Tisochrysis_lutea.AAC.2